jgi:hypothetical protein
MSFPLIFKGKKILREKKNFCGFLIKSANKKKNKEKIIFLSERLNSKYANKKFNLKILYK